MTGEKVLFVCTHNSARSQMAEAMLRHWAQDQYQVYSAGTHPSSELRAETAQVMAEVGIDVSAQQAKGLDQYAGESFDWLITVCDKARSECPTIPGVTRSVHWSVGHPCEIEGDEATRLQAFRAARDDLRNRVRLLVIAASREELGHPAAGNIRPRPDEQQSI